MIRTRAKIQGRKRNRSARREDGGSSGSKASEEAYLFIESPPALGILGTGINREGFTLSHLSHDRIRAARLLHILKCGAASRYTFPARGSRSSSCSCYIACIDFVIYTSLERSLCAVVLEGMLAALCGQISNSLVNHGYLTVNLLL
jgi:hypothetical protein